MEIRFKLSGWATLVFVIIKSSKRSHKRICWFSSESESGNGHSIELYQWLFCSLASSSLIFFFVLFVVDWFHLSFLLRAVKTLKSEIFYQIVKSSSLVQLITFKLFWSIIYTMAAVDQCKLILDDWKFNFYPTSLLLAPNVSLNNSLGLSSTLTVSPMNLTDQLGFLVPERTKNSQSRFCSPLEFGLHQSPNISPIPKSKISPSDFIRRRDLKWVKKIKLWRDGAKFKVT